MKLLLDNALNWSYGPVICEYKTITTDASWLLRITHEAYVKRVTRTMCQEEQSSNWVSIEMMKLQPHRWAGITDIWMVSDHCVPSNSTRETSDREMLRQDPETTDTSINNVLTDQLK